MGISVCMALAVLSTPQAGSSRPPLPAVKELADQLSCTVDFFEVDGCPAFLIRPKGKTGPSPMPWVWYAPVIGHPNPSHAWMLRQWLAKGIGMAGVDVGESYGSPRGRKVFTALWETLTHALWDVRAAVPAAAEPRRADALQLGRGESRTRGLHRRDLHGLRPPQLSGHGEGERRLWDECRRLGRRLAEHNPIDRLAPLAKAGVPILHVHGDADTVGPAGEELRRVGTALPCLGRPSQADRHPRQGP